MAVNLKKSKMFWVSSNCFYSTTYNAYSKKENWDFYKCNEKELISLAKYYYHNSDVIEEIDLDNLDNAIAFIERVDIVTEII